MSNEIENLINQIRPNELEILSECKSLEQIINYKVSVPVDADMDTEKAVIYAFIRGCCKRHKDGLAAIMMSTIVRHVSRSPDAVTTDVNWLLANGWIDRREKYKRNKHGYVYVLTAKAKSANHRWEKRNVSPRKVTIGTKRKISYKLNKELEKKLSPIGKHQLQTLDSIDLDEEIVAELLKPEAHRNEDSFNTFKSTLANFVSKNFYVKEKSSCDRIFTNANGCDTRLRSAFSINGTQLVELDLVSSHPYWLQLFTDPTEKSKLRQMLREGFYAYFDSRLDIGLPAVKKAFSAYLNGGSVVSELEEDDPDYIKGTYGLDKIKALYEATFPKTTERNRAIRKCKMKNGDTLGMKLQKTEAKLFVDYIGKWAIENKRPYLSVHDSVMIHPDDFLTVMQLIMKKAKEMTGVFPQLSFTDAEQVKTIIFVDGGKYQTITKKEFMLKNNKKNEWGLNALEDKELIGDIVGLVTSGYAYFNLDNLDELWLAHANQQGIKSVRPHDGGIYITENITILPNGKAA